MSEDDQDQQDAILLLESSRISNGTGNIPEGNTNTVSPSEQYQKKYAENPMMHSVVFILFFDFFERFAMNGVMFTMQGYLTGMYDPAWNPGFA